jgi:triphosphatase
LREQLPLRPEPRSKLQRGLALLAAAEHVGTTPAAAVGARALAEQLNKLREAEPDARTGVDPEGVHDMRVATRRLRTFLVVLSAAPDLDAARLQRLRRRLKPLARALGDVRDLDVLLGRLLDHEGMQPKLATALAPFHHHLQRRRDLAGDRMEKYLDGGKLSRLRHALEDLVDTLGKAAAAPHAVTVAQFAGGALWSRYEAVLREGDGAVAARDTSGLHLLRIACKRLRYALELFAAELGAGCEPLIGTLKSAQDTLGTLHDAVVERELLAATRASHPRVRALAAYDRALAAECDQYISAFEHIWTELSGTAFRRPLADVLGAL